jgi:hypothetical protein
MVVIDKSYIKNTDYKNELIESFKDHFQKENYKVIIKEEYSGQKGEIIIIPEVDEIEFPEFAGYGSRVTKATVNMNVILKYMILIIK